MGAVQLGISYFRRDLANTPEVFVRNLLLEQNPANQVDQKTWLTRPGAKPFTSPNNGVLRGLAINNNQNGLQFYVLSGTALYTESISGNGFTALGVVPGTDLAIFAESTDFLVLSASGTPYVWDGMAFYTIPMPNNEDIAWVAYANDYFLFGVSDSQIVYFMTTNEFLPISGPVTVTSAGTTLTFDSAVLAGMIGSGLVTSTWDFSATNSGRIAHDNRVISITPGTGVSGTPGTVTLNSAVNVVAGQVVFFYQRGPQALDFFSIETHPDVTRRGVQNADQMIFYSLNSLEIWQTSGNADAPFNRVIGGGLERGLIVPAAMCKADNTVFWVGDDLKVYRLEAVPVCVSTPAIEEQLRRSFALFNVNLQVPVLPMWELLVDGHPYVVLTIDGQGTFAYDVSTGEWLQWQTADKSTWDCQIGISINGALTLAGNANDTALFQVAGGVIDAGGIGWQLSGGIPVIGNNQRLDDLVLFTNAGYGGTLLAPVTVNLEISNDQGGTFIGPIEATVGAPGDFFANPLWQMMGQMQQPQTILNFSGTALSPMRISYARFNEYSA